MSQADVVVAILALVLLAAAVLGGLQLARERLERSVAAQEQARQECQDRLLDLLDLPEGEADGWLVF